MPLCIHLTGHSLLHSSALLRIGIEQVDAGERLFMKQDTGTPGNHPYKYGDKNRHPEAEMQKPENLSDFSKLAELSKEMTKLREELDSAYAKWEGLQEL